MAHGTAEVAIGRCAPAWPRDALRMGFGGDLADRAALKWLPGFKDSC